MNCLVIKLLMIQNIVLFAKKWTMKFMMENDVQIIA